MTPNDSMTTIVRAAVSAAAELGGKCPVEALEGITRATVEAIKALLEDELSAVFDPERPTPALVTFDGDDVTIYEFRRP
jgi:hypothetical protein